MLKCIPMKSIYNHELFLGNKLYEIDPAYE